MNVNKKNYKYAHYFFRHSIHLEILVFLVIYCQYGFLTFFVVICNREARDICPLSAPQRRFCVILICEFVWTMTRKKDFPSISTSYTMFDFLSQSNFILRNPRVIQVYGIGIVFKCTGSPHPIHTHTHLRITIVRTIYSLWSSSSV